MRSTPNNINIKEKQMKKRLLMLALALVMILQCACAVAPADVVEGEAELADNIISSDEVKLANATSASTVKVVANVEKAYVRGGSWANKNWHKINEERMAQGLITSELIVVKNPGGGNGMQNSDTVRVALFKYDLSGITLDDIGYAYFNLSFPNMDTSKEVTFDIYWVDENWDEKTVTWNTKPAILDQTPLLDDVLPNGIEKINATIELKNLVASGKKTVSLMVVQNVGTEAESRISLTKSTELTFPHFVVYKDASIKNDAYVKMLVDDEAENKAIWDWAKKMYDEWYVRYTELKNKPLVDAELIVSDESQYNKTSYSYYSSNPSKVQRTHKTRTYGDLTDMSKYVDVNVEQKFDKYGGIIDEQMRQEATGFFYSTKIGDRWWVIDPLGYPCYVRALSGVTYSYQNSPKQKEAAYELFGSLDKWGIATTRHLMNDLYFNVTTGTGTEIASVVDGMVLQRSVGFIGSYGTSIGINNSNGGSTTFSENNTMPVWDPEFVTWADTKAQTVATKGWVDDANIIGYTTDNELPMQADMIYDYMNISPAKSVNYYSYACTWYWVTQMTGKDKPTSDDITEELEQLFRGYVWDRYYNVVCNAIRKYDQNHMILGTRFLTVVKDAPWVLRFAGEYLDCITINWYSAWEPQAENIYLFATNADVPFMVTEFYAKAEENEDGLTNRDGAGFYVKTQQDRADHYQSFTLRLLEAKNCIGWHWFQYTDNDPTGNPTDVSSRDANKGIVSNTHREYTDLTDDMTDINKNVYKLVEYFDAKYAK